MPGSPHRTATQWLLLCALFLGVVGMHHVTTSGEMSSGHDTQPVAAAHHQHPSEEPAPASPEHDVLHLCVAVLSTVAPLLLLAWLLVRSTRQSSGRVPGSSSWPRAPDSPPPVGGRALLSSTCVLRL